MRGINVHAISPIEELAYDNQKDTKQLVGFSSKQVLQLSDAKKRAGYGSTELRSHLTYGRDLGVDVVQNVESGYAFNLPSYLKAAAADKKNFVNVAANALADQLARNEITNDCACYLRHGLFAREECVVRDTKLLAPVSISH